MQVLAVLRVDSESRCCLQGVKLESGSFNQQDECLDGGNRADVLADRLFDFVNSCLLP